MDKDNKAIFDDLLQVEEPEVKDEVKSTENEVPGNEEEKVNAEDPKEEEGADSKKEEVEVEDKEDDGLLELDDIDLEDGDKEKSDAPSYQKVAEFLGVEDASETAILDTIATMQSEKESLQAQLEQKGSAFYDDDLKKMNDIAKSGGDYKEYLNRTEKIKEFDVIIESLKKESPENIVREYYKNNGKDNEWIEKFFDTKEDFEIENKASEISEDLIGRLSNAKNSIKSELEQAEVQAKEFKKNYVSGISTTANKLESLSGVKIRPSEREQIKRELLADGVNGLFPKNEKGEPDYATWVENAAKIKMHDKLVAAVKRKAASKVKSKQFDKLHNIPDGKDNIQESKVDASSDYNPLDDWGNN